ncbi:Ubiquitin-like protein 4A [Papilio xuthus]|uniref:Ubiquitin-like protein 4A n=1 Tax=Papilio xuthus TaxID=66420 RepID=A0A194Q8C0_PAPXU|nr:Ubiquitin-like protein 4A [Papilio xuthus]
MRITVKKLQGGECILEILPTTTITEIKKQVFEKLGIPVKEQKLLLVGRTLADDQTVAGYPAIKDGSKINLVVKKPEGPIINTKEPLKKPEESAKIPEVPAQKLDRPIKKPRSSIKNPEDRELNPVGLYKVSKKMFKKQGMNDTEAGNTAKKLLRVVEDKFNQMSWDDVDKLCLDCLLDERGVRRPIVEKDPDCEDIL